MYISNGTDTETERGFITDVGHDLVTGLGGLKQTRRYEQERNALLKAREKYQPKDVVLTGHSLGGAMITAIAPPDSKAYTFNPYSVGQAARPNVMNFRSQGDVVSLLAPKETTTTLAPVPQVHDLPGNFLLKAHAVDNARNAPVFF
jgi:hypothetical protein